jgi:hypothetical protein
MVSEPSGFARRCREANNIPQPSTTHSLVASHPRVDQMEREPVIMSTEIAAERSAEMAVEWVAEREWRCLRERRRWRVFDRGNKDR